jgi:EAL domain-containing protein (putative c-di-GMP-specific phosphodiesterase class I)/CheY-like chemotaxis protein
MDEPLRIADLRMLVVEDHGFQRWALANVLTGLGAREVLSAPDGQSALEIVDSMDEPLDVIVTDLDMPGMDGMEFIRHIGERKVPAALILASGLERSLVATVESLAKSFGLELLAAIEKPTTARKLEAALQRYRRPSAGRVQAREAHRFDESEIREGLRNDEFKPFFQAKMGLADLRVAGAEALARWLHPTKGVLLAASFIEFVRGPELSGKFALTMAHKAAQACREWQSARLPGTVSINLSSETIQNPAFTDRLLATVREQGLDPSQMTLEITGTGSANSAALENRSRLRMHGFGLSIDDYGIGHATMERHTLAAFTELKIDRAVVRAARAPGAGLAMLEASLEMARTLRIPAVAEGVETNLELDLLRTLGCDQAQGFLIARPMDQDSYLQWLRQAQRTL